MIGRRDYFIVGLLFIFCYLTFRLAPRQQSGGDSRYSLLLSDNLIRHRDFTLERYNLPTPDYRLEEVGGHSYYVFPPGTSILSIPYVGVMRLRGVSPIRSDGSYNPEREGTLDAPLAALLTAAFAGVIYLTARLLLPVSWALTATFVSTFGTQVFSTTSRGLWSDTWGVLLTGLAGFLLLRSAVRDKAICLPLLATIEAWACIVRPTNFVLLVGTALYLILTIRRLPWGFLITTGTWLGLFFAYSWRHFHRFVPGYYEAERLGFEAPVSALLGNLVSPSRGLLVCVPLTVAIALILVRYRRAIRFPGLVKLLLLLMAAHMVILSGFRHWWGGHCYGARLTAGLVPWIIVLGILAIDARREMRAREDQKTGDAPLMLVAGILSVLSVAINSVGAVSLDAQEWNLHPNIYKTPGRLWSWRHPQVLAPFLGIDPT